MGSPKLWREERIIAISWSDFDDYVETLAREIELAALRPRSIVAIAKGGLITAVALSSRLDIKPFGVLQIQRNVSDEPFSERAAPVLIWSGVSERLPQPVLLVDDIVGTGDTLNMATSILRAEGIADIIHVTLAMNENALLVPSFYARTVDDWVRFPWETTRATGG